jgi:hypothetical protein
MPSINFQGVSGGLSDLSTAATDLFAGMAAPFKVAADQDQAAAAEAGGQADLLKGQGDILEGQMYGTAASLASLNATYTGFSTRLQQVQADRALFMNLGSERAAAAGSGSSGGGSAADILRASASQGALNRAVLGEQGLITQAGYQEQAQSYGYMQQAANVGAQAEDVSAAQEQDVAAADQQMAKADKEAGTADYIATGVKAGAGIISLFTPAPAA